jgi:TonB-linked SusC/RagA family outer membrane protein
MRSCYLKLLFLSVCTMLALSGWSQSKQISGVISSDDGKPISGANVTIKGKPGGTQTNEDGEYSITASNGDLLVFSYSGYVTQEAEVGAASTISITLSTEVSRLDEVVVVGYSTAKRSKLTSSVSKLDPKVLETGLRSNPAQALAGTIPGLRVATTTGRPGALPEIILRGGTNFDGTGSPLILMDGQIRGSLSDINPEDIGSIEVLKDASATAIYGARASNGVILITSKKGKNGSSSINLSAKKGTSYLNSPYNYLSASDYIKWARRGLVQAIISGNQAPSTLAIVGPKSTGNLYKDPVTGAILDGNYDSRAIWSVMRLNDVNRELLNQPGWSQMKDAVPTDAAGNYDPNGTYADLIYKDFNYGYYGLHDKAGIQEYNVGMSGGNNRGSYFANLGYYDEDGLSLKTFYRRLTFTFNGDYKIKEWLKSESSFQFNRANWRDQSLQNGETNYWGRMLSAPPTMRGTNANGDLILGLNANDGNPVFNIDKYKRFNQTDKFTLGQAFRVDLMKGLYVRVGATWMYDEGHYESFNQDFRTGFLSYTNPNTGWDRNRNSSASFDRTIRQTYNATANYETTFLGKNNIQAMIGYEYYDAYARGLAASGRLAPTDDFADLQLTLNTAATQTRGADSYHQRERIMSGFGNILYNWDGKYLASFTVRRDGVSRLLGDNQYGTFPAASIGWLVTREGFMSPSRDWLSYLKLRASWGKNGNIGIGTSNGIGLYEVQGSYGAQSAYAGTIGFLNTPANPQLRWEKTNTKEIGADFGLLKNRLNGSISYYTRITDDKLANVQLPTSSGLSSIRTNNGSMRNRGLEIEATYKIIQQKDLTWQVGANAAWNKNTILKLPYNGNEKNRQGGLQIYDPGTGRVVWVGGFQEGQEWGEIFGFVSEGIIRNDKDLADYNKIDLAAGQVWQNGAAGRNLASQKLISEKGLVNFWATQLGDMKWRDIDNNDTIDYRDRVSLGRTLPRVTGGFNTTVSWKGLSLFVRLDFAVGHVQQDFQQLWSLAYAQGDFNATDAVFDTWTPENPNAKFPRYTRGDQIVSKNFDRPSSMFYVNSSYLAFREVSLRYAVPASVLRKAKMSGLTFTVTGQNLGYLTNGLLNLPERTGSQNAAYIIPTQLIFGANLSF